MKRIPILLLFLAFTIASFGQSPVVLFGHAPNNFFSKEQTADRAYIGEKNFLWSFDAIVTGPQISLDKVTNTIKTEILAGTGFAFGYKHFKMAQDSSAVSDWGISIAGLTNVKLNDVVNTHLEVAVLANIYNFIIGPAFIFKENKIAFIAGATIKF